MYFIAEYFVGDGRLPKLPTCSLKQLLEENKGRMAGLRSIPPASTNNTRRPWAPIRVLTGYALAAVAAIYFGSSTFRGSEPHPAPTQVDRPLEDQPSVTDSVSLPEPRQSPVAAIDLAQSEFDLAKSKGTVAAWDEFLNAHGTTPLAEPARVERGRLAPTLLPAGTAATEAPLPRPRPAVVQGRSKTCDDEWRGLMARNAVGEKKYDDFRKECSARASKPIAAHVTRAPVANLAKPTAIPAIVPASR
jgi:hypothetical protein